MKLAIFGVTCGVGHQVVLKALNANHQITMLNQNPTHLTQCPQSIQVLQGTLFDANSLSRALYGQDAVISTLPNEEYIENLLKALKDRPIKRFIGILPSDTDLGSGFIFLFKKIAYKNLLKKLKKSLSDLGIQWTLVKPSKLTYEPPKGDYRLFHEACPPGEKKISIDDLADFTLSELNKSDHLGQVVALSY